MPPRRGAARARAVAAPADAAAAAAGDAGDAACPSSLAPCASIHSLTDEVLVQVFLQLSRLPEEAGEAPAPPVAPPAPPPRGPRPPFATLDDPLEPGPGLRAYPFLAQVCRRWRDVLSGAEAMRVLWSEIVVDYAHELITAVHAPLRWSDARPSDAEYSAALGAASVSTARVLDFVRARRGALERLTVMCTQGHYQEDGAFVDVAAHHDLDAGALGVILGTASERLRALRLLHVNDLYACGAGPVGAAAALTALTELRLEELQARLPRAAAAALGRLHNLRALGVTAAGVGPPPALHAGLFFGIDAIPDSWSRLALTALDLRGNALLTALPPWAAGASWTGLRELDVSGCSHLDLNSLAALSALAELTSLALGGMRLSEELASVADGPPRRGRRPPRLVSARAAPPGAPPPRLDLAAFDLAALSLAENDFISPPRALAGLHALQFLDLSNNQELHLQEGGAGWLALPRLRWLDLRGIAADPEALAEGALAPGSRSFWPAARCATMAAATTLARTLRRRRAVVLLDVE